MSLLIFTFQKHRIISEKASTNYKLMNLRDKLLDMQKYAACVSDGTASLDNFLTVPSSMFNRLSIFMQYGNATADLGARANFQNLQMTGGLSQMYANQMQGQKLAAPDAQKMQAQIDNVVFNQLKQQQFEKVAAREKKLMDAQETKIQQEIAQLEGHLNMINAEEEKVTKAEEEAAKKSAPNYVA